MSKKTKGLGKSLIKDLNRRKYVIRDGTRHTHNLPDGFDWGRLNLHSVTEQTSVDEFLDKAQLAQNEYAEEFSNIQILSADETNAIKTGDEFDFNSQALKHILRIPRRPSWDSSTTKEELEMKEEQNFLDWRRNLALMREKLDIDLTPYEKNLEIWRQLWRVVEKSDIIMQVIDARNPLLFRCEDLETYVKEIDDTKINILLINKADFLSEEQRKLWVEYFDRIQVRIVFFSALLQLQEIEMDNKNNATAKNPNDSVESDTSESVCEDVSEKLNVVEDRVSDNSITNSSDVIKNSKNILSRKALIDYFKETGEAHSKCGTKTVGFVGYPNVGKSSTLNSLLMSKRVQVSATPGKTKHFQTHVIDSELCLCDCPGLVFPNFVSTKAEMVINGILPIDQLTNHIAPVTLVTNLIPRSVLETKYSIMIPLPAEGKDASSPPTAEEFLNAYGYMRGFMTQRGLPDTARVARYILKDFISGKLLYCFPPPDVSPEEYSSYSLEKITCKSEVSRLVKKNEISDALERNFFSKVNSQVHMKGKGANNYVGSQQNSHDQSNSSSKPWKKHHNRNRKEKLRRVYAAADH